jgi:pantoate--beta-alanine ligase
VDLIASKDVARKALHAARATGASVGLVPTMGALHLGHVSLVEAARRECDCVAVSIFVNPTQFGDPSDLAAYPRDLDTDLEICRNAGADVIFAPSVTEMYPLGSLETAVVPGSLADVLEGPSRPGHFTGVATVVTKLLSIAGCCRAYFGEKDFQQLAIVRRLVADLDLEVDVVGCSTVREPDGLAMASRNGRLDPSERRAAAVLWRALSAGRDLIAAGATSGREVSATMTAVLGSETQVHVDYAVVADPASLRLVTDISAEVRLLVAARVGPVRLIDNIGASPPLPMGTPGHAQGSGLAVAGPAGSASGAGAGDEDRPR